MAIKDIPTNFRVYYMSMRDAFTQKKENAEAAIEELTEKLERLHKEVASFYDDYLEHNKIRLKDYEEFNDNEYKTGEFLRVAKGAFINRKNNYELVSKLYDLYSLAKTQKDIYKIKQDIEFYNKILNISIKEYKFILETYYTEVHKHLVLKGEGYSLGGDIGWLCFNRCKLVNPKPKLNGAATKLKKKELLEQGVHLFNKEEADFCKENGLDYNGADYRVWFDKEYVYEIPLLDCHVPGGYHMRFQVTDRRARELRGKTNQDLAKECNNDTNKICELPLDVKTKLNICVEVDKMLYTKFIRNENQKPYIDTKINRKNRQRL